VRLVLVPGFTQTKESWDAVIGELRRAGGGPEVRVVAAQPGHAWDDAVCRLAADGGHGTWVGYSMGGRLALAVALDHPTLVDHLVLVSATAGIRDDVSRRQRVADDEALAASIETDGVAVFLDRWLAQPMFVRVPPDATGLADRRRWSARDLASVLRNLGTGAMPNLWDRLGELTVRVTIVTGVHDTKFDAIGDELAAACARAEVRRVRRDTGHAVPLEDPSFLAAIMTG